METLLFRSNWIVLCLIVIFYTAITTFIQNKILVQIIKIQGIKKLCIIQTIIVSIIRILLPNPYCIIAQIITELIIYKKQLKLRAEMLLFIEKINLVQFTIIELICIKILQIDLSNVINILSFSIAFIIIQCAVYILIKRFNLLIEIPEYLSDKSKVQIIRICAISIVLILIDNVEILRFINTVPNMIYILDILLLLAYYFISTKSVINIIQIEKDKNIINALEGKNDRLTKNYDSVSSFRHDFNNIMQGIGGFITTKDLDGLQKMYNDIIGEYKDIENTKAFSKDVINNPAIYNLIANKYLEAKKFNIKLKLDVYIDFNTLKIKTYELCRILGILIDNAIEAAKECEEKVISIKFIKDNYNNRNLIIIENSCKNYLIDINKIKEKGFSTKKDKLFHGIGLWKVNQIIKKNENLRLYTSRDKLFKQQLEIYSWD